MPMTTSSPLLLRRMASLSMLWVFPTPGAYPRKSLSVPPCFSGAASSSHCSGVLAIAAYCRRRRSICRYRLQSLVVNHPVIRMAGRFAACAAALFLVVRIYTRVIHVNPTTVALTFLVSVLIVSAVWGLRYALFTAFVAAGAFNYYFLPPTGTFTIADTQNWVALFALITTAVIASELSDRARRQTDEAVGRRLELERL